MDPRLLPLLPVFFCLVLHLAVAQGASICDGCREQFSSMSSQEECCRAVVRQRMSRFGKRTPPAEALSLCGMCAQQYPFRSERDECCRFVMRQRVSRVGKRGGEPLAGGAGREGVFARMAAILDSVHPSEPAENTGEALHLNIDSMDDTRHTYLEDILIQRLRRSGEV